MKTLEMSPKCSEIINKISVYLDAELEDHIRDLLTDINYYLKNQDMEDLRSYANLVKLPQPD